VIPVTYPTRKSPHTSIYQPPEHDVTNTEDPTTKPGFVERRVNPDRRQNPARALTPEEIEAFQKEATLIYNASPEQDGGRQHIGRIYHGKPTQADR
jgi:hypothetical protein